MDFDANALRREMERSEAVAKKNFAMMGRIVEYLRTQQTDDLTPISLKRAVCHPLLGGILRRDPSCDVPGPSFTENSLRLAISKGHLECTWVSGKQYVTPAALRTWLATTNDQRKPGNTTVVSYRPPAERDRLRQQQGKASVANASAKLLSMKETLSKKKGGK